jgi:hypothetical protein
MYLYEISDILRFMFKPVKRKQECCSEYGIVPGYVMYIVFKLNDET